MGNVVAVSSNVACRILRLRRMNIGERPNIFEKRAMKAERLKPALYDKLLMVCAAPGRATMSAKARAIWRSLRIENRSVQLRDDFIDRLTRAMMTCFSKEAAIAPVPIS